MPQRNLDPASRKTHQAGILFGLVLASGAAMAATIYLLWRALQ